MVNLLMKERQATVPSLAAGRTSMTTLKGKTPDTSPNLPAQDGNPDSPVLFLH